MPASRHLNPDQLKLFMKPSEIKDTISDSVEGLPTGSENHWYSKDDAPLRRSIASGGVKTPVILDHAITPQGISEGFDMGNGHHRVENAHVLEEQGREIYVPVLHTTNDYMGYWTKETYPDVYRAGA